MEELSTKYKLKTRTIISSEYTQFLYRLYLPLIGPKAVFLYNFLVSEYQYGNRSFTLKDAVNRSKLNLTDFIFERKMLESIGLVSTYKKENNILLIINPIYSPKNFFNDEVLKGLYVNEVGKKESLEVIKHYEIDDNTDGYSEITSSIRDNFSINFDFDNLKVGENIKLASTNKVQRIDDFDDVALLSNLKKITNIRETAISPDELKSIHNTGVLFSLSEKIMAEIMADSFDPMKPFGSKIDLENVNKRAKSEVIASKSYNNRHKKADIVKINEKSDISEKVNYYQSLSPRDFLKQKQGGVEPVSSDLDLITYLNENMGFDYPVINVILDYTLLNTDNQLNRKYVEKIAASLVRNKVTNVIEAISQLYGSKKKEAKKLTDDGKINVDDVEIDESIDLEDIF